MLNTGHVISVGDVLATLCLRRVERRGWVDNFQDLSLPGHLLPLTAEGAMRTMGIFGNLAVSFTSITVLIALKCAYAKK